MNIGLPLYKSITGQKTACVKNPVEGFCPVLKKTRGFSPCVKKP